MFFQITGPWNNPQTAEPSPIPPRELANLALWFSFSVSFTVGALLLARYNIRAGRGDRRGSFRLAMFVFATYMVTWLLMSHHVPTQIEWTILTTAISQSALLAGGLWLMYIALEPYVRRRWPHAIVSWSRILAGRLRDQLVGADLLFGVMAGTAWTLLMQFQAIVNLGLDKTAWWTPSLDTLLGARQMLGRLLMCLPEAIVDSLAILFIMLALRMLVRRQWLAGGISVVLFTLLKFSFSRPLIELPFWALFYGSAIFILIRFGLVALTTGFFVLYVLRSFPITADLSAWYADTGLFVLMSVFALSIYGCHSAIMARPLLARLK